jgi:hypothetical protein
MIDFTIAQVSQSPDGYREVVRELASRWPEATGLQIVFVLVSAADAIERVFAQDLAHHKEVDQTMKMAALLSTDLFALQRRANFSPTGRDLVRYWKEVDPYFIKL